MNNHVIQAGKAASRPLVLNNSVQLRRKFLRNCTEVECHVFRWCRWYMSLWRTVRLEHSAAGNKSNSFPNPYVLPMIYAVENAQRGDVAMRSQSIKPFTDHWFPNDSNGFTLYANKWFKLMGCTSPKMRTVLHMRRPQNLGPILFHESGTMPTEQECQNKCTG